jgi:hypothetical protein
MATKKIKKGVSEDTEDFVVVTPIKHNGEDYQIGEIIALTERDGVPLLALGAIKVDDEDFDDEASSRIDDATEIKSEIIGIVSEVESDVEVKSEIEVKPESEAN